MKKILAYCSANWGLFYMGASAAVLGAAYFFQYVLGYQPCELCLYQRYPYMLAFVIAAVAFTTRHRHDIELKRAARGFLIMLIFLMFLGAFIAAHHIGVEMGYWQAFTACTGIEIDPTASVEDILKSMPAASIACDQPQWKLFGISMAGYNFIIALGLAFFGVYTYNRTK